MFKIQNSKFKVKKLIASAVVAFALGTLVFAQEQPPKPGAPRAAKVPLVAEKKLANGLTVATVERKNVPLVTIEVLVKSGAGAEEAAQAGLANLTASMLTKGTKTRTATQIAEQIEFLGGSINTAAGWNNSVVQITVTNDKLDQAMAILSDVVLNPSFKEEELDLLKSQALDGLNYNLKQPGFLANYVASKYTFNEHPAGGTPETIGKITTADVAAFKKANYFPENAVLIFTGDVKAIRANALAQKFFGRWRNQNKIVTMEEETMPPPEAVGKTSEPTEVPLVRRLLVVDLPNSGQASVNYTAIVASGRIGGFDGENTMPSDEYYAANVLNSVLGGGYSSRLNQEIRIKRGLSYGAGSAFAWRFNNSNFSTSTQTKNESAAEVAGLVLAELNRLSETNVAESELAPRKLVLTGDFGRDLETTGGLAERVGELYGFELPKNELSAFIPGVKAVTDQQIKAFAKRNMKGGNLVIVGDYAVFKDDLAKRFPDMKIEVVKADELDLSKENLRK